MMRYRGIIFCVIFALAGHTAPARGEAPEPNRTIKVIDFEERQLGNNEDLPMHWTKVTGVGLPHYVNGILSTDRAHSGQYSFRFDLNGGSLVYRYDAKQLPVLAGAHYRMQCYCQTTTLAAARACMTAYFTDQDGHPLTALVRRSELYAAADEHDGWHKLIIELNADDPKAAFMTIELGLLQPAIYAPRVLGDQTILPQDYRGSAWFDDVSIAQVPEVTLATDRPGNIFRLGDPLKLTVVVNDLFTDDLQSRMVVSDATGATVYQYSGTVDLSGAVKIGPTRKQLTMALPKLPPGWYRAGLQLSSKGRDLGEQSADFVQLADSAEPTAPDPRFGVNAIDLEHQELQQLSDILPLLAVGRVKMAVWTEQRDVEKTDPAGFDELLEKLEGEGIAPTACLTGLPPSIAAGAGGVSLLKLLTAPADSWQPQLSYLISRHANNLQRWQLGADDSDAFVNDIRMRRVYQLVYKQFTGLLPNPDLAMPWPAWYDLGDQLPATVALSIPPQILPEQIPLYIRDLHDKSTGKQHNFSLALQLLDDKYSRMTRLEDLAQRVIYSLSGGATRIDLPLPYTVEHRGESVVSEPKETFIVDRTLMRILSGAEFKGKAPLQDDITAMLFDRRGQGIMALWSRGAAAETRKLSLYLGPQVLKVDLWGNATPLERSEDSQRDPGGGLVTIEVGPMPIFLVGVDTVSAQIRAGIAFDEPLLESSFQLHTRQLTFSNPSNSVLNGTVRLRPPKGWTMTPATFQFSILPNQQFDRKITIDFPYSSLAGNKTVTADFSVEGETGSTFSVPMTLTLGLSDVGMHNLALREGDDLVVEEMVTNYGEKPIDYTAYAMYPGLTRQERLITSLLPGRSVIKMFRFKNVKFVANGMVRCGVRELEGTRILNDEVEVQ